MAKRFGFDPFILLTMTQPPSAEVTGGGTGQSTTDPYACDFDDWNTMFAADEDNDGDIDFDDYRKWFQNNFGSDPDAQDLWELCGNDDNLFP